MLGGRPYVRHDVTHARFCENITEISSRSRPMGPGPTSITPDFFFKTAEPTALASTGHSNQTNISAYY